MILDRHENASVHNAPRLPDGSLSVLVGRHGAMNPAGRVRIRNIMPIARDYSRASQSFLFACLTRAKHDLKPPGRWCSAGEREDIMKTRFTVALSMLAGAALGGGAIQALHAQATPPVYYVSEIDVSNPDAYAKEYASKSQALIKQSGGRFVALGGVAGTGAKSIAAFDGEPPKRFAVLAWDSMEKIKA